jgi:hypothetical protein|tara:strand:+ start:867 stop:1172 length:306 start_codon:yes stop_codon:yes gene_type:complete
MGKLKVYNTPDTNHRQEAQEEAGVQSHRQVLKTPQISILEGHKVVPMPEMAAKKAALMYQGFTQYIMAVQDTLGINGNYNLNMNKWQFELRPPASSEEEDN